MTSEKGELRAILDNLPLGIAYLDAQFRFIRINKFFADLTGMKEDDLLGKPCYETVGEYANDPTKKGLEKICSFCKKEDSFNLKKTCVIERPLKESILRVKTIPQLDEGGETHHLLELFEDITECKLAEEGLRDSERKFRMLSQEYHTSLNAIQNSIFLLSPDLKVIWANKHAGEVLGCRPAEMERRPCFDLLKNAGDPCPDCPVLDCFRTGDPVVTEISFPDKRIWAANAYPVPDEQGRVNKVIIIYRDITEETRLRAETMHAWHLASLGELAAGVAHEINNPINGIVNYAQILMDRAQKATREHDIAGEIIGECRRITKLVRNLLSFARSGKDEKTSVSISEILSKTLSLSQRNLENNGVHLKINLPTSAPPVLVNSNQILQVFLNIINNALYALNQKYPGTHKNKTLEITGKEISREGQPSFQITLCDRGTGIPGSILSKIADPFFSTKPTGHGTGLGLSISYGIIRDHDGRMHIESQEGAFTRVIIELPAQCEPTPIESKKIMQKRPRRSRNNA